MVDLDSMRDDNLVQIHYTDADGNTGPVVIRPHCLMFGQVVEHMNDPAQWFLQATEMATTEIRYYAMKNVQSWEALA